MRFMSLLYQWIFMDVEGLCEEYCRMRFNGWARMHVSDV